MCKYQPIIILLINDKLIFVLLGGRDDKEIVRINLIENEVTSMNEFVFVMICIYCRHST